jgi:Flp pilus assembly protein TadG
MSKSLSINRRRRAGPQPGRSDDEAGQSILEMAIVLPILLFLLVAVVDLARAFDAYIVLTNAVREGARFGSRDPIGLSQADIQQLVAEDVLGSGTNVTNMTDFATSDVAVEFGTSAVTVTVTYDFELWFGGLAGLDNIQLEKESVMPIMTAH